MIETKQIERPKLILIADDIELNRDALEVVLDGQYNLLFAENGKEALEIMRMHREDLSMLILDLNMPVMNGYEVMERLREDELLQHIPVIVLTADKSAELQALQMGAADFITKPFDIPEIILERLAFDGGVREQERGAVPDLQYAPQKRFTGKVPVGISGRGNPKEPPAVQLVFIPGPFGALKIPVQFAVGLGSDL